jgi:hypothetical protein
MKMKDKMIKKGLVVGIIVLFVIILIKGGIK